MPATGGLDPAPVRFRFAGASIGQAAGWCSREAEEQRTAGQGVSFAGAGRDSGGLVCHVALFGTDWTAMITEIHKHSLTEAGVGSAGSIRRGRRGRNVRHIRGS